MRHGHGEHVAAREASSLQLLFFGDVLSKQCEVSAHIQRDAVQTMFVSGLLQLTHSTYFLMNSSSSSWRRAAVCDPLTI